MTKANKGSLMTNKGRMVYVIDDDESVRKSFARLLQSADIECETFSSPEEFLGMARQEKNACIIADIRMPGSTGFELAERLITLGMRIPIIVVSASDEVQVREHARELGAAAFFQKPVDDQALLDAISWALSGVSGKG
jgi:two-component system, LuxR family, response regulator FixJ